MDLPLRGVSASGVSSEQPPVAGRVLLKHVHLPRVNVRDEERRAVVSYLSNPRLCQLFSSAGWLSLEQSGVTRLVQQGGGGAQTLAFLQQLDRAQHKFLSFDALIAHVARMRQQHAVATGGGKPASAQPLAPVGLRAASLPTPIMKRQGSRM